MESCESRKNLLAYLYIKTNKVKKPYKIYFKKNCILVKFLHVKVHTSINTEPSFLMVSLLIFGLKQKTLKTIDPQVHFNPQ